MTKKRKVKNILDNGRVTRRMVKERGRTIKEKATQVLSKTIWRMAMASGSTQMEMYTKGTSRTIYLMAKAPTPTWMGIRIQVDGARVT